MDKIEFSEIYSELKRNSSSIVDISQDRQESIQKLSLEFKKLTVLNYCFVTFFAVFMLMVAPAVIYFYYDFVLSVEPILKGVLTQKDFYSDNVYVRFSALLLVVAVPFYTIIMPLLPSHKFFGYVRMVQVTFPYVAYAFILNYVSLIIPISYLISYEIVSGDVAHYLLISWLLVPVVFLIFIPAFLLAFLAIAFFDVGDETKGKFHLIPSRIIYEAGFLLRDIKNFNQSDSSYQSRKELIWSIGSLAHLVRSLRGSYYFEKKLYAHLEVRFLNAANAIDSLKLLVMLPDSKSKSALQRRVESIFNIFASGNYSDLPLLPYCKFPVNEKFSKYKIIRRFISFFIIAGIFSAPLFVWGGLMWMHQLNVPVAVQPLLPILYSIWCLMVILTFSDKFMPEEKSIFVEMFKLLLAKK